MTKGNLVNWDDSSWHLDPYMEWIEKGVEEVCLLPKPRDTLFPEYRTNEDLTLLCNKLKGQISVVNSQAKQDFMVKEFKRQMPSESLGDLGGYSSGKLRLCVLCLSGIIIFGQ